MATKATATLYEPDQALTVRPVDVELDEKLTGKPAVDVLAMALRDAAFEFDQDDIVTITTADDLSKKDDMDADEYARGYDLLSSLAEVETRITTHYNRFDKPLNFLISVVRSLKSPQVTSVTPIKQALSKRLGRWKADRDEQDRLRREQEQAIRDAEAKAAQAARAQVLERVAEAEADPRLAESFREEAESVRTAQVHAAPVETRSTVPVVPGGFTCMTTKCEFTDVKELLRAYVEGRCYLDEEAIKEGLQSSMDKQAVSLGPNMSKAFPGTKAVSTPSAVRRRAR